MTWQEKAQVMESKKCRRHSKIGERGTHSIDRMVERKTSERDSVLERFDMDQNKQRLFCTPVRRIDHEVRQGYTNSDGLKNRRPTMVERSTKKTQFEVERPYTRGVSLAGDGKRRSRSSKNTKTGCQQM